MTQPIRAMTVTQILPEILARSRVGGLTEWVRAGSIFSVAALVLIAFSTITTAQTTAEGPAPNARSAPATRLGDDTRLEALPALGVDETQTSVSGISSGAYMAGQFQFAHGDLVVGAAIVAGGPYGCAVSSMSAFLSPYGRSAANSARAVNVCMLNLMALAGMPSPGVLATRAERSANAGEIAPLATVRTDRIYLFTGQNDNTVRPGIVRAAARFYERIGVPADNVKLVDELRAGHGFVTEADGNSCETSARPYVVNCDFDLANDILAHIYGPLETFGGIAGGGFIQFDQAQPTGDDDTTTTARRASGLDAVGMAFIPDDCRARPGCRVHIAFHGCQQGREKVGDVFVGQSGFARWAVTNRIVVLFPQVRSSMQNPQGCWDWWGYSSPDFLTKNAPQIVAVRAMLAQLAERP